MPTICSSKYVFSYISCWRLSWERTNVKIKQTNKKTVCRKKIHLYNNLGNEMCSTDTMIPWPNLWLWECLHSLLLNPFQEIRWRKLPYQYFGSPRGELAFSDWLQGRMLKELSLFLLINILLKGPSHLQSTDRTIWGHTCGLCVVWFLPYRFLLPQGLFLRTCRDWTTCTSVSFSEFVFEQPNSRWIRI